MSLITLDEVKTHLRIKQSLEDSALSMYIGAAEAHIANYTNQASAPVNPATKAAALLIVGDLYANKEAQTVKELHKNEAVEALLYPYREDLGL